MRFRYFISSLLSFISLTLTCFLLESFSLAVQYHNFTATAPQGDLTTMPAQCCRWASHHLPKNFMAQAKGAKLMRKDRKMFLRPLRVFPLWPSREPDFIGNMTGLH